MTKFNLKTVTDEDVRVSYSSSFEGALKQGKVLLRRVFTNRNGISTQLSVQFIQRVKVPEGNVSGSAFIGFFQGIEDAGYNRVTTILPMLTDQAKKVGLTIGYYCDLDQVVSFEDLVGQSATTEITDTFWPNPKRKKHIPHSKPDGTPMLHYNPLEGKVTEYYRHTQIVPEGTAKHQFITDTAKAMLEGMPYRKLDRNTESRIIQEQLQDEVAVEFNPVEALAGTGEGDSLKK